MSAKTPQPVLNNIVADYMSNPNLTNSQLAEKHHVSHRIVTVTITNYLQSLKKNANTNQFS